MIDTSKQPVRVQATDRSQLEARLRRGADTVIRAAMRCVETAGRLAYDNQDKVQNATARVAGTFDEKTHGRYAPKVAKVQDGVHRGMDKMAGYRPRT